MKYEEFPQYCDKCGNKLMITKSFPSEFKGYDSHTREKLYSCPKVRVSCPEHRWWNLHKSFTLENYKDNQWDYD